MQQNKYYNYIRSRLIDFENDGCTLDQWKNHPGKALFAKHPKGFLVFIPYEDLSISDEYIEVDPYNVELDLSNDFHVRRIDLTITLLKEAVNNWPESTKILDLGCGQGHITNKMSEAAPKSEISGLDLSLSAIEYAHDHFQDIDFAVGSAYDPPYAKDYFDVVVCNNLWEHVPDPLFLLSKISTILKPDGFLIISTPSRYRFRNFMRVLHGKEVVFLSKYHITEYSVGQIIEQLRYGGYSALRITSRPIKADSIEGIMSWIYSLINSFMGSHHCFESTVFILAQRSGKTLVKSKSFKTMDY